MSLMVLSFFEIRENNYRICIAKYMSQFSFHFSHVKRTIVISAEWYVLMQYNRKEVVNKSMKLFS